MERADRRLRVRSRNCRARAVGPGLAPRPWLNCLPLLLAVAAGCSEPTGADVWPSAGRVPVEVERAVATVTGAGVRTHVEVLAADSMLGRDTPSPGLRMSAAYLAGRLAGFGLEPAFAGSWQQPFACGTTPEPDWPTNVGAVLRGSDPRLADEWVVVTAHYDHLGVYPRATPDSVFNGADDNASGTAAVVEIARALSGLRTRPARTIAFLAFAAEERGLVGAWWFVHHAPAGARLVADINLDMIGRNDPAQLYESGEALSSLGENATRLAARYPGLTLTSLGLMSDSYHRSDQYAFAVANVPAIFFTSGTNSIYHTVRDEAATLDVEKIARVARLAAYITWDVASRTRAPSWTETGLAYLRQAPQLSGECVYRQPTTPFSGPATPYAWPD